VEPDERLAEFLRRNIGDPALRVVVSSFEDADLEASAFDLGVSATAFHWLEEDAALRKVARLLRPGGWWAAVWNVFGDDSRPDPFHLATKHLDALSSPSAGPGDIPFALDAEARIATLVRTGAFAALDSRTSQWSLVLDADQTVALYATYSNISLLPEREAVLAEIGRIARDEFGGRVIRNMTTSLYLARRKP
jgi:SAM-dependent methyltransferase